MQDIKELSQDELKDQIKKMGWPAFHAEQIFSWIYARGSDDFSKMSDLPVTLRSALGKVFSLRSMDLVRKSDSSDGTRKFLLKLRDDNLIEAVAIPAEGRVTGCLSVQAGCRFGCKFCASGQKGHKRNLSAGEILEEVLYLKDNSPGGKLTHIVFMGVGEPLDNYDHVLKAVRIINSPRGLNIGARRITISTCGIIPGIVRLAKEGMQIELSVSLHAADDLARSRLLPINKKYPIAELIRVCREYIKQTNRQITFEYVLINGVNSSLQNAKKLIKILKGLNCKVNLIPANAVTELEIFPPGKKESDDFRNTLVKSGVRATLRRPRGEDIDAACGQLRLKYEKR